MAVGVSVEVGVVVAVGITLVLPTLLVCCLHEIANNSEMMTKVRQLRRRVEFIFIVVPFNVGADECGNRPPAIAGGTDFYCTFNLAAITFAAVAPAPHAPLMVGASGLETSPTAKTFPTLVSCSPVTTM